MYVRTALIHIKSCGSSLLGNVACIVKVRRNLMLNVVLRPKFLPVFTKIMCTHAKVTIHVRIFYSINFMTRISIFRKLVHD